MASQSLLLGADELILRENMFEYRGPRTFLGVFYLALSMWTLISAALLIPRAVSGSWPIGQVVMAGFVVFYTWYFSLGISYILRVEKDGSVEMQSLRRSMRIQADEIDQIEGPRFAVLPFGFLRIRHTGGKIYLFCRFGSLELADAIKQLRRANKKINVKFLPS